jgi:hypothetical protein
MIDVGDITEPLSTTYHTPAFTLLATSCQLLACKHIAAHNAHSPLLLQQLLLLNLLLLSTLHANAHLHCGCAPVTQEVCWVHARLHDAADLIALVQSLAHNLPA